MSIFKRKNAIETRYDYARVMITLEDEFSFEEIQSLKIIATRYLAKCNEEDAKSLRVILKDFVDDSSDYGSACICKEILRVGA